MSDITAIKTGLAQRAQSVAEMLLPNGHKEGNEWRCGSVGGEKGASLGVHLTGPKAGIWMDFATGEGGDLIDLWQQTNGLTFVEVLDRAREFLGMEAERYYQPPTPKKTYKVAPQPTCHTPQGRAFDYLREDRNISAAAITAYKIGETESGNIVFPFVKRDGTLAMAKVREPKDGAKPKPTASNCEPILMGWQAVPSDGRVAYITEGEIDALSLYDYGYPALSAPYGGGGGNKQQWVENEYQNLLQFERIYLVYDNDKQGDQGAAEVARRLGGNRCWRVRLPKKDANECLMRVVPREEIAAAIESAERLEAAAKLGPSVSILISRRASEIAPEPIEWLWRGRIARGKHTIVAGEPGTGKSQLSIAVAAAISTGGEWPCDEGRAPLGSVIVLSAEDGAADTIVPRLSAAEANRDRIHIIRAVENGKDRRSFDLKADLGLLEQKIVEIGDVALVIVDPISSYMGKTDSHKNADVRGVLEPIAELADRTRVAVLTVTHFSKPNGGAATKALHKFIGSVAFGAAARAAFAVLEDPDDKDRRLFLHAKNNLAEPPQGLAFRLEQVAVGEGIVTSRVDWEHDPITTTADEALATDRKGNLALIEASASWRHSSRTGRFPRSRSTQRLRKLALQERPSGAPRPVLALHHTRMG
jgi:RecA-family ATPase